MNIKPAACGLSPKLIIPFQIEKFTNFPLCRYLRHVLSLQRVFSGNLIKIAPSIELAKLLSDGGIGL